ncbi:M48 family metallopeptidase [bacterium]|nr:M48 family metallopeptidase [bacterium]
MSKIRIDKIIRSKRRTLALEIEPDASLIVRAPQRISLDYIEQIVQKKRLWIQSKQQLTREKYVKIQSKEFVNGEGFLYLGHTYSLSIVNNNVPFLFDNEFLLSRHYLPKGRKLFMDWYKKAAYQKIGDRLDRYSSLSGLKYNKFGITIAQKRWGSCNYKNNLSFSWRLIMAPLRVIDYVVVHELVHTVEKNHSKRFWSRVKLLDPNYQNNKKWIKENEHRLII